MVEMYQRVKKKVHFDRQELIFKNLQFNFKFDKNYNYVIRYIKRDE